jgi:hypothetical protein
MIVMREGGASIPVWQLVEIKSGGKEALVECYTQRHHNGGSLTECLCGPQISKAFSDTLGWICDREIG